MILGDELKPCGPVVDPKAAARAQASIAGIWTDRLERAWPSLAPVFAASSYLAGLARRSPERLEALLASDPVARLEGILAETAACGGRDHASAVVRLRELKGELHLLTALCDLGGIWDLDQVTGALTLFADAAVMAALTVAAKDELAAGRITRLGEGEEGPVPGWFCIAMGKQGAFELNYSSDIDVSVFFHPDRMPLAEGIDAEAFAVRLTHRLADLIQARTPEGYVFRMDLRLRPDPSSTQAAVPVPAALDYYESVGQNWERAAFIKARACAGDLDAAEAFLRELSAFVWRRNLDFSAIADIHSIKRQIHAYKVDERMSAKGMDLKLGRGGIREIEFYVQTQQLILGGRNPALRSRRTLDALQALAVAGHVTASVAAELTEAYRRLRSVEHRIQMISDEQTHRLPDSDTERRRIAALSGYSRLSAFDAAIVRTLRTVNARYGELFPEEEPLSSRFGSLVFTGVDDDPETLATLARMGFSDPQRVARTIRSWHHGHIPATATERGRELFTRLAPRLLDAAAATGSAEAAFGRFRDFFARLSSGVQLQSLFLAQPKLFDLIVRVMAFAPRLAGTLARRPAAIDAMLDAGFFQPVDIAEDRAVMDRAVARIATPVGGGDFEAAMDAVQVMSGAASAERAGKAFAALADLCISVLAEAALAETRRIGGDYAGEVAVVALGKCGSREMNAASDLDIMTLYRPADPSAVSSLRGWDGVTWYGRFTQRLIAALSSQTAEGGLYQVDMQLRPSGTKGPVAVSFAAFEDYYAAEAETWELMALTRARVAWCTSPTFATEAQAAIDQALRRPRSRVSISADVLEMRALMARERPPRGAWDLKLGEGGLVDIEFAAQFLQLAHAANGGPLRVNTAEALEALQQADLAPEEPLLKLRNAWRLQQDLTQLLKLALEDGADPAVEPAAFRLQLAKAGGARNFRRLSTDLKAAQASAHLAYREILEARA